MTEPTTPRPTRARRRAASAVAFGFAITAIMVALTAILATQMLDADRASDQATAGSERAGGDDPATPDAPPITGPRRPAAGHQPSFTTTATAGALDAAILPARLVISSIGVDAPVEAVGLDDQGRMQVPESGSRVGWYQRSAIPGEGGTAVLTSHVDTAAQGPGALFELVRAEIGDEIQIIDGSGDTTTWTIVAITQQHKDALPSATLYDATGGPRIAVVTCAGRFDPVARAYEDNLIAWAEPR